MNQIDTVLPLTKPATSRKVLAAVVAGALLASGSAFAAEPYFSVNDKGITRDNQAGDGAKAVFGIAIGTVASSQDVGGISVGRLSSNKGNGSISIGVETVAEGSTATAVGSHVKAIGKQTTAVGQGASVESDRGTAVGRLSQVTKGADSGVALGAAASAEKRSATALGSGSTAGGVMSIAVGPQSRAQDTQTIAIGRAAKAEKIHAVAMGSSALAAGNNSIAFGTQSEANKYQSVAVGRGAKANHVSGVALGSFSETDEAVGTNEATVGGVTYGGFAGNAPSGNVSIGSVASGLTRTLTNVAAGRINATSTDAINGSQLHAVAEKVGGNAVNIQNLGNRVAEMDEDLRAGIAGATAIAFLQRPNEPGKSMVSMAVGGYRGEQSLAVGYARNADNNKWSTKFGVGINSQKHVNWGGSVGYQW